MTGSVATWQSEIHTHASSYPTQPPHLGGGMGPMTSAASFAMQQQQQQQLLARGSAGLLGMPPGGGGAAGHGRLGSAVSPGMGVMGSVVGGQRYGSVMGQGSFYYGRTATAQRDKGLREGGEVFAKKVYVSLYSDGPTEVGKGGAGKDVLRWTL